MTMKYRDGRIIAEPGAQDKFLARLYGSVIGRTLLRPLVSPVVSKVAGCFLSSRLSACLIKPFIRSNGIDMTQFEQVEYRSYNEFFSHFENWQQPIRNLGSIHGYIRIIRFADGPKC